jgi:TRAP-type mannitol/chloroaromatic compound transport system permease small subunit
MEGNPLAIIISCMMEEIKVKILRIAVHLIDSCSEWIGRIFQWAIVLLVILIMVESVARKAFSSPLIWFTETSYFLFGYYIMFGSVYTFLHGGHVAIDIFSEKLSEKWRHGLAITCLVLLASVFALAMVIGGTPMAIDAWVTMEQGHSVWRPPLAHFRTVIPVAFSFIFLQGVSSIIKHAAAIKRVKL